VVIVPGPPAPGPAPATAPANGEAAGAPPAAPSGPVAVLAPPTGAPRLLMLPAGPGAKSGQISLNVVDYDTQGAIRFAGLGRPATLVRLYVDNKLVGEATVDAEGHWGMAPGDRLGAGTHRLRADDLGPQGKVVSRVELPFQRADVAAAAGEERMVVQPRQTLWRIAQKIYGNGNRYLEIYTLNHEQIRDPNKIYPGQLLALPAEAAGSSKTGAASSSTSR
jgi:nucleoid-associated protein YgaU